MVRAGADVHAFTAFYRQHHRSILTLAEQRLAGRCEAEDVTSEVFRIAWKRVLDGHPISLPWAYQVLRNVIGNEYRRISRADALLEAAGQVVALTVVESSIDTALQLRAAMQKLALSERELLYMAYWEDLSGRDMALIFGCTTATVRVRLLRARRKLHAVLKHDETEGLWTQDGCAPAKEKDSMPEFHLAGSCTH